MAKEKDGRARRKVKEEPSLEEPSAVSTSRSQGPAQRPQTSPYTSSPIAFYIGPKQTVYYVPQHFLQNPEWLDSLAWGAGSIFLPDVDENSGHVLVHYLYTGTYQTLNNIDASPIDGVNIEFKRAIFAYVAAEKYKLQDLQQLAKHQIEQFSAEMHIFDIVDAIKENFSELPDENAWFHDYLVRKAKTAFEEDHTVFAREDFFDRINDGTLGRLLVKCVIGLYNDKVSRMINTEGEPVSEQCVPDAQDSIIKKVPVEECFAIEETPAKAYSPLECQEYDITAEECYIIEEPSVEDCSVPAEVCYAIEEPPYPCSLLSKKDKKKKKKKMECYTIEEPSTPVEECYAIGEPSVPVEECYAIEEPSTLAEECHAIGEPPTPVEECYAIEEPLYPRPPPSKKDKKKKKMGCYAIEEPSTPVEECYAIGEPSTPAEECYAIEEPSTPVEECYAIEEPPYPHSFLSKNDKKKKKRGDLATPQEAPIPSEPAPESAVKVEYSICHAYARHLLEGDTWKDCKLCQDVLRQIAIRIARKDYIDEDGYEIVDQVLMG